LTIFIEAVLNLATLNIGWFIDLIFGNLFWVFAFAALAAFFYSGKNWLLASIMLVLWIWLSVDTPAIWGLTVLVAGFLAFNYVSRVAVLTFASTIPALKGRLVLVNLTLFIVTLAIYHIILT